MQDLVLMHSPLASPDRWAIESDWTFAFPIQEMTLRLTGLKSLAMLEK